MPPGLPTPSAPAVANKNMNGRESMLRPVSEVRSKGLENE
jgi:hypothetical protein